MKQNQYKAFLSLDFVFAILPVLLIIVYGLSVSELFIEKSNNQINSQILFNKLVSVSDYVVRYAAVEKEINPANPKESKAVPNKISTEELANLALDSLREQIGLSKLEISFEKGGGTCIYRLVLYEGEIKKLYFCGELVGN